MQSIVSDVKTWPPGIPLLKVRNSPLSLKIPDVIEVPGCLYISVMEFA